MGNYQKALDIVFHSLAYPARRAVIQQLGRASTSVRELEVAFDIALPSFMKNIGVLKASGLIDARKIGRMRLCKVKPM